MFEFLLCALGLAFLIPAAVIGGLVCSVWWLLSTAFETAGAVLGVLFAVAFGVALAVGLGIFALMALIL